MHRSTSRIPGLGIALSALVTAGLLMTAGASSVFAADTRLIDIGSTVDCGTLVPAAEPNGQLVFTDVSAGQLTKFDLKAKNCGGQNLSNVIMTAGHTPPETWDALSSPYTDGTTIVEVYGPNQGACSTNSAKTLLTCTAKSLRPGATLDISVVLRTPSATTATGVSAYAAIKAAENTNDGGRNEDTFEATGTEPFAPSSCDSIATFLATSSRSAATCAVGAPGNANAQQSVVRYEGATNTAVKVAEIATGTEACVGGTGKSPVGADVLGDLEAEVTDTVTWTITIDLKAIGKSGVKADSSLVVCHWNDDGLYSAATITNRSKTNKGILTVTFTTQGNGKARIYA